jgi:hypothetical protein
MGEPHPLEMQNNAEMPPASPILYFGVRASSAPASPGNNPGYGRPANGMTDELNQLWADELGNIMVAQ